MLTKTHTLNGFLSHDRGRLLSCTVLGAGALTLSLLAGWHVLHRQPAPAATQTNTQQPATAANPYGPMIVGLGPWARTAAATAPAPMQTAALDAEAQPAAPEAQPPESPAEEASAAPEVPTPPRRPAELKSLADRMAPPAPMRQAALPATPDPAAAPADNRSFFEKVFGGAGAEPQQAAPPQPAPTGRNARRQQQQAPTQALAYAPQESTGGLFGALTSPAAPAAPGTNVAVGPAPRAGDGTAVYDISAHTVYMPDGTRLEAHSGLGPHLDDPRFVHIRMKGPTPPSVYALSPREALFHGVEALRLTPIGGNSIFGRAGLLAHTYMLGPKGDSNGCVSFRDYGSFLQAYKRGAVRRLVVVARM